MNPVMGTLEGSTDWGKTISGAATGTQIGTNINPGWGSLIGGLVGAGAGGTWVGGDKENDGLASAFRGNVSGDGQYGTDMNWLQMITTASDLYGSNKGNSGWWDNIWDYAQPETYDSSYRGERNPNADYGNDMLSRLGSMYNNKGMGSGGSMPMGMSGSAGSSMIRGQDVRTADNEEDWWDNMLLMHMDENWGDTRR